MKTIDHLRKHEIPHPILGIKGTYGNGCFIIPYESYNLKVISSDGSGWDHVSVSLSNGKLPNWKMLCYVKDLFFDETETVVQFFPKKSEYLTSSHPQMGRDSLARRTYEL